MTEDNGRLTFDTTETGEERAVPLPRFLAERITASFAGKGPDDPVAQTGRLAPGDASELLLQLIRQLCSGFAEHGEVPQQRVTADPICSQLFDRDTLNQS